jgi:hypothetical protein
VEGAEVRLMDFPADIVAGPFGGLSPWDASSVWNNTYAGGFASRPWQSANTAVVAEVFLPVFATLRGFSWANGGAVSGNVDCGLYDSHLNRIASTGSTAQAGTNATQAVSATATRLAPGNYYVALALDNTTGTILSHSTSFYPVYPALGIFMMASAFPLPSTLTLAAPSFLSTVIPLFSALINASVV